MSAIASPARRCVYAKSGPVESTYSSSDVSGTYVVVVVDNGWREVTVDDLETIVIKEPAQEQDEPDTDERSVTWERPNRRLATVNRAGRKTYPRKAASTWG
jgi:hypothetical protein